MSIKLSLVDNDFVVKAKADLEFEEYENMFSKFLKDVGEELAAGNSAYLEIEGSETGSLTLEICKFC